MGQDVRVKIFSPVEIDEDWLHEVYVGQKIPDGGWNYIIDGTIEKTCINGVLVYELALRRCNWWCITSKVRKGYFPEEACVVEWVDGEAASVYACDAGGMYNKMYPLQEVLKLLPEGIRNDPDNLSLALALSTYFDDKTPFNDLDKDIKKHVECGICHNTIHVSSNNLQQATKYTDRKYVTCPKCGTSIFVN